MTKINLKYLAVIFLLSSLFLSGIKIEKALLFNKYTLEDNYKFQKKDRSFQWDKIKKHLDSLELFTKRNITFASLSNYKNINGAPDNTINNSTDAYGVSQDQFGTRRAQSIPLYDLHNNSIPIRYSNDGSFVALVDVDEKYYVIEHFSFGGRWKVPKKYVKPITASHFDKVIFIDRRNQNIATMERIDSTWFVRSMNPATTGVRKPPYKRETPIGAFVLQNKLTKMIYYVDGTTKIGGYSPFASRFCGGAYIHGVPVDLPRTEIIEYSYSLGTTPRSHMCVRNATSHAKYVFDWAEANKTLIFIIE